MPDSSLDPGALDGLLETVGGDRDFVVELIDVYIADAPLQLQAMRAAVDQGDAAALVAPAHTLKGTSASMGANGLAGICAELEALARSGDVAGAEDKMAAAEREYGNVDTDLGAARAGLAA